MRVWSDVKECLNIFRGYGLEWEVTDRSTMSGYHGKFYKNNIPIGSFSVHPRDTLFSYLTFWYDSPIKTTHFISEEGGIFSRLPMEPDSLKITFNKKHYPMLAPLIQNEIQPREIITELGVKSPRSLVVGHRLTHSEDHLCIKVDPEFAHLFPQARYQPEQQHYCIHGSVAPLIPEGYESFDELTLGFTFWYRASDYLKFLKGLPIPADARWTMEFGNLPYPATTVENLTSMLRIHVSKESSEHHLSYLTKVENAIKTVNVLTS